MLKKVKNIFYLLVFIIFISLAINFYFSEENIRDTNKLRSLYSSKQSDVVQNLPLLKNDTKNVIEYKNEIEIFKSKKKNYTFWDLIKNK